MPSLWGVLEKPANEYLFPLQSTQMCSEAIWAAPGSLLEMQSQVTGPHGELLTQNLHFNRPSGDSHAQDSLRSPRIESRLRVDLKIHFSLIQLKHLQGTCLSFNKVKAGPWIPCWKCRQPWAQPECLLFPRFSFPLELSAAAAYL